MTTNENKLKQAFEDKEFLEKMVALDTPEEVSAFFKAEKDVEITPAEITKIFELLEKHSDGELSDDELEDVAGGLVLATIGAVVGLFAVWTGIGVGISTRRW